MKIIGQLALLLLFSIGLRAIDFPHKHDLFEGLDVSPKFYYQHDTSEYQNSSEVIRYFAQQFHNPNVSLLEIERTGGGIINGQLGLLSSRHMWVPNRKISQLRGVIRPIGTVESQNENLFLDEIHEYLRMVYATFKKQLDKNREVFSADFIDSLRKEDNKTPFERIMFFSINNVRNRDFKAEALRKNLMSFFAIFDGQKNDLLKSTHKLPFEMKHPEYELIERKQNKNVLEIKRLISPGMDIELSVRVIAEHLIQAEMKDYSVIVHTDLVGARYFKRFGLSIRERFSDKTVLLTADAKNFIQKNVPKKILDQYSANSCNKSFMPIP